MEETSGEMTLWENGTKIDQRNKVERLCVSESPLKNDGPQFEVRLFNIAECFLQPHSAHLVYKSRRGGEVDFCHLPKGERARAD